MTQIVAFLHKNFNIGKHFFSFILFKKFYSPKTNFKIFFSQLETGFLFSLEILNYTVFSMVYIYSKEMK